jgi:hypothetical protein
MHLAPFMSLVQTSKRTAAKSTVDLTILNLCILLSLLFDLPSVLHSLQNALSILVQLQLGNRDIAWMYAQRYRLAVRLFPGDSLNVDNVF